MLAAGSDNNSERKNECLQVIDAYLKPKCHPADSDAACRQVVCIIQLFLVLMQVIAWASCCSQGAFSCLLGETWAFKKQFIKTCKLNRWPSNWASQSVPYCCKLAYELLYYVQGSFSASISTSQTSRDMCSVLWVASRENRFFSRLIGTVTHSHVYICIICLTTQLHVEARFLREHHLDVWVKSHET